MNYSVVIVAAGTGSRMNAGYNKVYMEIEPGLTILEKTMNAFRNDADCKQIIVVSEAADYKHYINKDYEGHVVIVKGGETRQESVLYGLTAVTEDVVLIHDGARPFITKQIIDDVKKAMLTNKACCVMVNCKDTVAMVEDQKIVKTLNRDELMLAQTPQAFNTDMIFKCACQAKKDNYIATDDASLVMKYSNEQVGVVLGDYQNYKITTREDLK